MSAFDDVQRASMQRLLRTRWIRERLAASRSSPVDGRRLDPQMAGMLRLDDIVQHSDLRRLSPPRARRRVAADIRVANEPPPPGVVAVDRSVPGEGASIPVRHYSLPSLGARTPGIVYIHGGGWVTGSIETHDGLCRLLAVLTRSRVVSIEYRLAPEHRFPAAVDDCVAATRWVLANAEELGIDPGRVAVAGDSAGGNLSAVVARRTQRDERRPSLQVLLYPALDGTCSGASYSTFAEGYFLTRAMCDWYYGHYLDGADRRHPDVSPLLAPDVSRVPALVYSSGFDPLRDEAGAFASRLRAAGSLVEYREFAELPHGFVRLTAIPAAMEATRVVAADIEQALYR